MNYDTWKDGKETARKERVRQAKLTDKQKLEEKIQWMEIQLKAYKEQLKVIKS